MFSKPARSISKVIVMSSDSDRPEHDDIAFANEVASARGLGENGAVHYFITREGLLQEGLSPDQKSALGGNAVYVVLAGLNKTDFTEQQFVALRNLAARIDGALDGEISFSAPRSSDLDLNKVLALESGKLGSQYKLSEAVSQSLQQADPNNFLQLGATGDEVKKLQKKLGVEQTEVFDNQTEIKLRAFQQEQGLKAHGALDPDTQAALKLKGS